MGMLMKHGSIKRRPPIPAPDATEEKMLTITKQIALGFKTPIVIGLVILGGPSVESTPKEADKSQGVKRDDKKDDKSREEKRQKKKDIDGGNIEDLEEMIGRDRG